MVVSNDQCPSQCLTVRRSNPKQGILMALIKRKVFKLNCCLSRLARAATALHLFEHVVLRRHRGSQQPDDQSSFWFWRFWSFLIPSCAPSSVFELPKFLPAPPA